MKTAEHAGKTYFSAVRRNLTKNLPLILVSLAAFSLGVPFGFILQPQVEDAVKPVIENIRREFSLEEPRLTLTAKIFFKNVKATLIMIASGALMVIPLVILWSNGFLFGFVLKRFLSGGRSILDFVVVVSPHGVLELPAVFVSGALGMRIGLALLLKKTNRIKETIEEILEAAFIYLTLVLPLLLAAAFVEAHISASFVAGGWAFI